METCLPVSILKPRKVVVSGLRGYQLTALNALIQSGHFEVTGLIKTSAMLEVGKTCWIRHKGSVSLFPDGTQFDTGPLILLLC